MISDVHPDQRDVFLDERRFKVAVCGRRWGKSVLGAEAALDKLYHVDRGKIFVVCPTREMVKDIFWGYLKKRVKEMGWAVKVNEAELKILRKANGTELLLKSADKPDRLRGRGLHYVVMDEYADMPSGIWPEIIRPALSDTGGGALFIGTPKGRNHFYEMYQEARETEGWGTWTYRTSDSPFIPKKEIEKARRDLDERTFKQEYESDFVDYLGAAYAYYRRDTHCIKKPFNTGLPIIVCCDFNIDPCIWELAQDEDGFVNVFGEVKQSQTDIWRMCEALKAKLRALFPPRREVGSNRWARGAESHPIYFYGDFTSSTRRDVAATSSSWGIIRGEFKDWNVQFRLRQNPRVVDRINSVNARQRSADGSVRFGHSPDCIELMKDFELLSMADIIGKRGDPERTHASDAIGYYISYEYPILGNLTRIL